MKVERSEKAKQMKVCKAESCI